MKKFIFLGILVLGLVGVALFNQPVVVKAEAHDLHPMYYGPHGWAGWSCPKGEVVITGGYEPEGAEVDHSLAWKPGASVGDFTYPTTPFGYTYAEGEEGWIVQAGEDDRLTAIWVECALPTPEPTIVPTCMENCGNPPTFAGSSTNPPVCSDGNTTQLVANLHVVRKGAEATVNFFITQGDSANIYYKVVGQDNWQFAVSDVKPNGDKFVGYTIGGLDPNVGYVFGVQQKQGCAGGQIATSVVVDGPAARTFGFSYWIW